MSEPRCKRSHSMDETLTCPDCLLDAITGATQQVSLLTTENKILLSSLEKEEQAHTMSVFDLNMKIAEVGIALEREKERAEQLEQENFKQRVENQNIGRQYEQTEERKKEIEILLSEAQQWIDSDPD